MADKIFFAGNELDAFPYTSGTPGESTAYAQAGFTRGSVVMNSGVARVLGVPFTDPDTQLPATPTQVYCHFMRYMAYSGSAVISQIFSDTGAPVVRERTAQPNVIIEYSTNGGTTWNDTGLRFPTAQDPGAALHTFDTKVAVGAAGQIAIALDGVAQGSWAGDLSAIAGLSKMEIYQPSSNTHYYQQVLVMNNSTIGHTVRTRTPSVDGAETGWTNGFAAVDEFPYNTTDAITTNTAEVTSTFDAADLAATAAGSIIKGVVVSALAKCDGSGTSPQQIAPVLRVGGTDYVGETVSLPAVGYVGTGSRVWPQNPATAAPWANIGEVNGSEFGVRAKA